MRIIYESISPDTSGFITCRNFDLEQFDCPYHIHPEIEIVRIDTSQGRMLAGDYAGNFEEGQIYMFGSRLPHAFINIEGTREARSQCIFLDAEIVQKFIRTFPEAENLETLLRQADRGILIPPEVTSTLASRMNDISSATGFPQLVKMMDLLNRILGLKTLKLLSSEAYVPRSANRQVNRMESVLTYIHHHSSTDIQMEQLAQIAAMSPTAFHRFFKQSLGCTPGSYLMDLRLSNVAHRLLESSDSVSEIAFASGFNNLSNFNRQFRRRFDCSPRSYRSRMHA
ncbi:MAG: helix-turn-helix domain-containing protein [Puniceicoccaceae bacterium]